jgi:hypothetical protein
MAFLLNSQQDLSQAVTSSLVQLFSVGLPAVKNNSAAPDPGLLENKAVSGRL